MSLNEFEKELEITKAKLAELKMMLGAMEEHVKYLEEAAAAKNRRWKTASEKLREKE